MPVSNFIPSLDDPHNIDLEIQINGITKQKGNTKDFIFTIPQMLVYISQYITLLPGDLILTGTPAGVGPVQNGDKVLATLKENGQEKARLEKLVNLQSFEEAKL